MIVFEKYIIDWRYFISISIFIFLYIVGILLPLDATQHYYNYMSRIWNWTEILISLLAVYYIVRTKVFRWRQAVISIFLGVICLISLFRDPRTADIIMTSICVIVSFYAGCRLYEMANIKNPSIHIGVKKGDRKSVV